jgi:flagellar biosynthetic protein FliR
MSIDFQDYIGQISSFTLILFRILGLFATAPLFSLDSITVRAKIILGLLISLLLFPTVETAPEVEFFSSTMIFLIGEQILVGAYIGIIFLVVFQAFAMAGHLISTSMGLSFSQMVDPATGVNSPIMTQYFTIMATLLFLSLDGHLLMIQATTHSFELLPLGGIGLGKEDFVRLISFSSYMFISGLLISMPVVLSLLLVNIAFGVVTRSAPALNIFAIGFPVTIIIGMFMLSISTPVILINLKDIMDKAIAVSSSLGS